MQDPQFQLTDAARAYLDECAARESSHYQLTDEARAFLASEGE